MTASWAAALTLAVAVCAAGTAVGAVLGAATATTIHHAAHRITARGEG